MKIAGTTGPLGRPHYRGGGKVRAGDLPLRAYRRLAARRGDKKAITAINHEILVACWHMLTTGEIYRTKARKQADERARKHAIRQLERLGHKVTLEQLAQAA